MIHPVTNECHVFASPFQLLNVLHILVLSHFHLQKKSDNIALDAYYTSLRILGHNFPAGKGCILYPNLDFYFSSHTPVQQLCMINYLKPL